MPRHDLVVANAELGPRGRVCLREVLPRATVVAPATVGATVRNCLLDSATYGVEVVGQVDAVSVVLDRHHSATDVDSDRRRDDRSARGDDASDGCADTRVDIRHDSDPLVDEREARDVAKLTLGLGLERDPTGPRLNGNTPLGIDHVVASVRHGSPPEDECGKRRQRAARERAPKRGRGSSPEYRCTLACIRRGWPRRSSDDARPTKIVMTGFSGLADVVMTAFGRARTTNGEGRSQRTVASTTPTQWSVPRRPAANSPITSNTRSEKPPILRTSGRSGA